MKRKQQMRQSLYARIQGFACLGGLQQSILAVFLLASLGIAQQGLRLHSVHQQLPLGTIPQIDHVSASGDLDGDGDVDLVIGNRVGPNNLLFNDGRGLYEDHTENMPIDLGECLGLAVFDIDQDGDLDIFFGNRRQQNRLLLNDGKGRFRDVTSARLPAILDALIAVDAADVDGDGDLDLVIANAIRPGYVLINDGRGFFSPLPFAILVWPAIAACQALVDVDGDSDLDLVVGSRSSSGPQDVLYLNDGAGRFRDVTSTHFPTIGGPTFSTEFFDSDQDGDQDLLILSGLTLKDPLHLRLLANDGKGKFTDVTSTRLTGMLEGTAAILDVDGDSDLDLCVAGESLTVLINRGGVFQARPRTPILAADSLLSLDADGDGDRDLYVGGDGGVSRDLLLNDGRGIFASANASGMPADSDSTRGGVVFADMDQDGDLDILKTGYLSALAARVYSNDGMGRFVDVTATAFPVLPFGATDLAVGDIDADGDLDLVLAYGSFGHFQNVILLQTAPLKFTFSPGGLPLELDMSIAIDMVDFDGDLDLDLVVVNLGSDHKVYRNNGKGVFSTGIPMSGLIPGGRPSAIACGDIDGDGDLDVVIAESRTVSSMNQVFLNDGSGRLVGNSSLPQVGRPSNDLTLADLDGDGDLDLVLANGREAMAGDQDQIFFNDGIGGFTELTTSSLPAFTGVSLSIVCVDIDQDGDLDLLFGTGPGFGSAVPHAAPNRLLLNDGTGRFTDGSTTWLPELYGVTPAMDVGDFDLDGDVDVLLGQDITTGYDGDGQTRIYENGFRQLRIPRLARIGQMVEYEFRAQQQGTGTGMAVLCLSTASKGKIHLAGIGILQLDPQSLVVLPPVAFSASGTAGLTFPVPANPALVNQAIFAQALVGHGLTGPYRLTNTIRHIVFN